ncbi:MAG: histone deacetylase [Gemmatimonadota bacterium]
MTLVITSPACLKHDPGPGHPETPRRLQAVLERLRREATAPVMEAVPLDSLDPLLRVHPQSHLDFVRLTSERGGGAAGPDTLLNASSWDAVLGATGAILSGVHHAHLGRGNAFAAVRPPGHHATAQRAMGFCLVNNVVVAAREAQQLGRERVLIVDWDVHHGNGTQALVEQDPSVRYVSIHQWPWYPGTGRADERGVGNIFNVPRPPDLAPEQYVADLWDAFAITTRDWKPDILLISAGFDAMAGDPLGGFTLEPEHYTGLTSRFREHLPDTPIVSMLEGGYAPARVAEGVAAHVSALG